MEQLPEVEVGNDGHKTTEESGDFFGGAFSSAPFPSAIKELVHPGKEVKELLMRTVLSDVNEARDLALTLSKCDEFDMEQEKQLLLYLLAARTSVKGNARIQLLQAITGMYSPGAAKKNRLEKKQQESVT